VDRPRVLNAYHAYSYFRWLDDYLDEKAATQAARIAFVARQQALVNVCYQGEWPRHVSVEEGMLRDLIASDQEPKSGLQSYIRNMMAVMAFDASRRGRLISECELTDYSRHLAVGVTDNLHYFIGHDDPPPQSDARYLAVTGAHITHMLRDTYEDVAAGYFNIPREILASQGIDVHDVQSEAYRAWVESRVNLARGYFDAGKSYIAQVKNRRCRLAGYAYIARFETVLNIIEKEGYQLRPDYSDRKSLRNGLKMGWSLLSTLLQSLR
jgi:phytoene/squalene synthetase